VEQFGLYEFVHKIVGMGQQKSGWQPGPMTLAAIARGEDVGPPPVPLVKDLPVVKKAPISNCTAKNTKRRQKAKLKIVEVESAGQAGDAATSTLTRTEASGASGARPAPAPSSVLRGRPQAAATQGVVCQSSGGVHGRNTAWPSLPSTQQVAVHPEPHQGARGVWGSRAAEASDTPAPASARLGGGY